MGIEQSYDIDIFKYKNSFNNIHCPSFTISEVDIFHLLCERIQRHLLYKETEDKSDVVVEIPLNKIFSTLNKYESYSKNLTHEELFNKTRSFIEKVASIKLISDDKNEDGKRTIINITFFPTCILDENKGTLKVRVNNDYTGLLSDVKGSTFTMIEMPLLFSLKTKTSKALYKLLKQFAYTGYYIENIDTLRFKLEIPASYKTGDVFVKSIYPAIEELDTIFGKITVRKIKEGRSIRKVEFIFTPIPKANKSSEQQPISVSISSSLNKVIEDVKNNNIYISKNADNFLKPRDFVEYLDLYTEEVIIKALNSIKNTFNDSIKAPKNYFVSVLSNIDKNENKYFFAVKE